MDHTPEQILNATPTAGLTYSTTPILWYSR